MPPLAEALRPALLDEVVGQTHLLGEGKTVKSFIKHRLIKIIVQLIVLPHCFQGGSYG